MDILRIALIHDYLREYGGAERVVESLHEMWPEAPLYTAFVDWGNLGNQGNRFKSWDIRTSWVQKYPLVKRWISPLRFLAPWIWSSFSAKGGSASGGDLSEYDVVISSSGWFMCRGVALRRTGPAAAEVPLLGSIRSRNEGEPIHSQNIRSEANLAVGSHRRVTRSGPLHICYIHHPPRNLYGYATGSDLQKYWPVRMYATIINFFLRHYDFETAQHVDYFVANSLETARRVKKFYRRESTVIYPPVETSETRDKGQGTSKNKSMSHVSSSLSRAYFLSVGRLTYAKRVDLAILACNRLKLPLKIVGKGKEEEYLRSIAGPTIEFVGGVDDQKLSELYGGAKALIFCALDEDFGMVPVEAMAHGTPVIGLGQGGVLETVIDPSTGSGKDATGVLFHEPTVESLVKAIKKFEDGKSGRWEDNCKRQAEKFSKERFQKELREFVETHTAS